MEIKNPLILHQPETSLPFRPTLDFPSTAERVNLPNYIYLFLHYNSLNRTFKIHTPDLTTYKIQIY